MNTSPTYVGIDVAKAKLDVASEPPGLTTTLPNTDAGLHTLVPQIQALAPARIVVEATGGYELPVVRALVEADLPVIVVNPRHVRDFAKALGRLAKTDTLRRCWPCLLPGCSPRSDRGPMPPPRTWPPCWPGVGK